MLVSQNLLDSPYIHTVLQHECCGGVAEFVGGILGGVQSSLSQPFFDHGMDHGPADPLVLGGEEEGLFILAFDGTPHGQIPF